MSESAHRSVAPAGEMADDPSDVHATVVTHHTDDDDAVRHGVYEGWSDDAWLFATADIIDEFPKHPYTR